MKKVSIVLPTYNGENFIRESIESIINQTYTNWELIIVNDCSTDNTLAIANEYAQKDSRIKVISNKDNLKLPASLNVGFANANGEYYTWTSDDNMYKPDAINIMVNYLNNVSICDFVSCDMDYIDEHGNLINTLDKNHPNRNLLLLSYINMIGACFMYRGEIAKKIGAYDETMFGAEDYDYWCRIALEYNIHFLNKNLYQYRLQAKSLTSTHQQMIRTKDNIIIEKYAEPIAKKCGLSKSQMAKLFFNYYKESKNLYWQKKAKKANKDVFLWCQINYFLKMIFSVTKDSEHKVITIFGIKNKIQSRLKASHGRERE